MSGRRERTATHAAVAARPRRKLVAVGTMLALAATTAVLGFVSASPASAASITANVQLASTGLADSKNPVGGSVIGIRPGDSVNFTTAVLPTAGLDDLGLGNLVSGLLGSVVGYQSNANFSNLPGGSNNTTVQTSPAVKFTFPKAGTYSFTWTVDKIVSGLLGKSIQGLDLNGNQLEKAGVKLNASNEYVGKVVVSNNPPKGGLSIQLPSVSVEPSLPVVGKLPKITIPGVNVPTIPVPSLGDLASNLPKVPTPGSGKSSSAPASSSAASLDPYQLPGESIPEQVVPGSSADEIFVNSGGGTGAFNTSGDGVLPKSGSIGAKSASADSASGAAESGSNVSNAGNTVELAADSGTPSSQLPVILAVLAIIALALVAGTYARLFLLKPPTSS